MPELPRALSLFLIPGGFLWALLYIGLEQFAFPRTLAGAIAAPLILGLNGFFGATLTQWSWSYAAYQIQLGSATAQFAFLLFLAGYSSLSAAGRKGFGKLGFWIALGAAVPLAPVLYFLSKYFLWELGHEENTLMKWATVGAFLLQVLFDLRLLYYGSALNHERQGAGAKSARTPQDLEEAHRLHEAWSGLTAIALVISTSAFVFGILW